MKKLWNWLSSFFRKSKPQPVLTDDLSIVPENATSLVMTCMPEDMVHLDSLARYYETPYNGLLSRGLWLLSLARNAEINDRRLAVIEVEEESGQILSVLPITVQ